MKDQEHWDEDMFIRPQTVRYALVFLLGCTIGFSTNWHNARIYKQRLEHKLEATAIEINGERYRLKP